MDWKVKSSMADEMAVGRSGDIVAAAACRCGCGRVDTGPLGLCFREDGSQCHAEGGVKSAVSPVGLVQVGASAEGMKMKQRRPRNGVARPRALRCAPPGLPGPLPRGLSDSVAGAHGCASAAWAWGPRTPVPHQQRA